MEPELKKSKRAKSAKLTTQLESSYLIEDGSLVQENQKLKLIQSLMKSIALRTQLVKSNYKKITSRSWEVFGALILMVESFDFNEICPKKKPVASKVPETPAKQEDTDDQQYVLVLDLDETLIHADTKKVCADDHEIQVMINKKQETYFVRKRPFLHEFLEKMSHFFELVVFTASLKEYADKVINYIDPKGYIKRRFYRDDCTFKKGNYYKDLTKITPNIERVTIIDNSLSGLYLNQENGMLIKSFYSDLNDRELRYYGKFLKDIMEKKPFTDIRKLIQLLKKKYPKNIIN